MIIRAILFEILFKNGLSLGAVKKSADTFETLKNNEIEWAQRKMLKIMI